MKDYYDTDLEQPPGSTSAKNVDWSTLEKTMKQGDSSQAEASRPGVFRCYDSNLGGELRTFTDHPGGAQLLARAELYPRDGNPKTVGTARYSVGDGGARLYADSVIAPDYATEDALLSEISDQARAQGAERLTVFVRDDDQPSAKRWGMQNFHPRTERFPGMNGVDWEKPL